MTTYLTVSKNGAKVSSVNPALGLKCIGRKLVHFKIDIKGENKYSPVVLKSANGLYVDDYFRTGVPENVNVDGNPVYRDERGIFSVVILEDYNGENVSVTDFNAEEPPTGELLGGNVLTQLKACGIQMMGYILDTVQGKTVVIDGGNYVDGEALLNHLTERGGHVDYWFITHYHDDHIGAVIKVFESGRVKVENICLAFPSRKLLLTADPKFVDYVSDFLSLIKDKTNIINVRKGDEFIADGLKIKVINDPCYKIRENFANDTSVMYKVTAGNTDILFTGDIGDKFSDELIKDDGIKAEISGCTVVQMSHHGNSGASKSFYDCINIKYCLYPTPLWLWNNDRGQGKHTSFWTTLETRIWMRDKNVLKSYTSAFGEDIKIK